MRKWVYRICIPIIVIITLLFIAPDPISRWSWNILISGDQLVNTVLGGDPDQTISARLGEYKLDGAGWKHQLGNWGCVFLSFFEDKHCEKSLEPSKDRSLF